MSIKQTSDTMKVGGNINVKTANSSTTSTSTVHGPWEFFKYALGFVTKPLNHQINIPSTAFTPALSLPTKAIFVNILKAKDTLLTIKNKIKAISDTVDEDHSDRLKQKQIVKINIVNAYNKYYKNGDK